MPAVTLRDARVAGSLVDVHIADGLVADIRSPGEGGVTGESIELDGRALVPGLWDNHVHMSQWATAARRLDLSSARSAAEAVALVASALRPEPGQPLVGSGFRDGLWPDEPTAALLDAVAPDVPVVLTSGDLHACWLNSSALARFAPSSVSTGLLREEDAFAVVGQLADVPDRQLDEWVDEAARVAASRGIVGIVDFEMAWNPESWSRRAADGFDAIRVEFGFYRQHLDRAIAEGYRSGDHVSPLVSVGSFKVIMDGSLNTRTAWCYQPYGGVTDAAHGILNVPPDELHELMTRAWAGGLRTAIHAIGDHANALALDAFDAVGCQGTIEHAQLVDDADFARFAALGVVASVQPEHAMDDRDVADHYWPSSSRRAFALRSLIDAGATIALGSDAPVAPLDPWISIAAAVERSRDDRGPWHPEQRITVDEAIAASTRSRIAVGEPADLVALDADPMDAMDGELRSMPVALTLLAGRATHRSL